MGFELANLYATITAHDAGFNSAIDAAKGKASGLEQLLGGMGLRTAIGWAAVGAGVRHALNEFAEVERIEIGLAAALRSSGEAVDGNIRSFKAMAIEIANTTGIEHEETLALATRSIQLGVSSSRMEELSRQAIGLATVFGMDYPMALRSLLMAEEGRFTQLSRMIPQLREAATAEEKLAIVRKLADAGFEQAEQQSRGLGGQFRQVGVQAGEAAKGVGSLFAYIASGFAQAGSDLLEGVANQVAYQQANAQAFADMVYGISAADRALQRFDEDTEAHNKALSISAQRAGESAAKHLALAEAVEQAAAAKARESIRAGRAEMAGEAASASGDPYAAANADFQKRMTEIATMEGVLLAAFMAAGNDAGVAALSAAQAFRPLVVAAERLLQIRKDTADENERAKLAAEEEAYDRSAAALRRQAADIRSGARVASETSPLGRELAGIDATFDREAQRLQDLFTEMENNPLISQTELQSVADLIKLLESNRAAARDDANSRANIAAWGRELTEFERLLRARDAVFGGSTPQAKLRNIPGQMDPIAYLTGIQSSVNADYGKQEVDLLGKIYREHGTTLSTIAAKVASGLKWGL